MDHTHTVPAIPVERHDDLDGRPGAFCFEATDRGLFYVCPCGCGAEGFLGFRDRADRPSWIWDGHRVNPTLAPSIRRTAGCRWHGHLVGGNWIPCGDSGR